MSHIIMSAHFYNSSIYLNLICLLTLLFLAMLGSRPVDLVRVDAGFVDLVNSL